MAMVNIPSTNTDPEYRYKMPRLMSKMEGRGNGIKTNIINMVDVARALNRPPLYAVKWFGNELGVKSHCVDKEGDGDAKCLIEGSHDISVFQGLLDEFINKYVCCEDCHLPEMDMYITDDIIYGKCKACGWDDQLDNNHRVANFIIKHPLDESSSYRLKKKVEQFECDSDIGDGEFTDDAGSDCSFDDQKSKKQKKEKKEKKERGDKKDKKEKKDKKSKKEKELIGDSVLDATESEDEKLSRALMVSPTFKIGKGGGTLDIVSGYLEDTAASKSIVKIDKVEQIACVHRGNGYGSEEVDAVIETLKKYIEMSGDRMSVEDFFDELRIAQLAEVFDHKMRLYIALEALLGSKMDAQSVLAQKQHLAKSIDNASMSSADVLWAFGAYIQAHPSTVKSFPMVLKTIYNEDWATEDDILEYYGSDTFSAEPGFLTAQSHAASFLKWLSTAESEDEDEEER